MSFVLSPTNFSSFSASPSPSSVPHTQSRFPSPLPTPSPSSALHRGALLIPTDRTLEDLEERWLSKLGKLRVDREVVLGGYALYSLRSWYLSRTHFSHTIVTQTGKPTEHISAYVLVPHSELSDNDAAFELANAIQFLATETRSQPRKTEYGTLLVATPSSFGQEINPLPGGDWRVAKPYMVVNTGLRRLGCGGRAVIGMESPIPALRRKFYELYRIPIPAQGPPLSRNTSPSNSPVNNNHSHATPVSPMSPNELSDIVSDPFTYLVVELVKLIQAALGLWGIYPFDRENVEIDGLFCDETKAAIFQWRRVMGMEHEESLKLEKETSGGCIDPKTLAALLSSVTSVRYELDALDVEKLPKDPFSSIRRFLNAWAAYQMSVGKSPRSSQYLSVSSIRCLTQHYLADRRGHQGDALKVHKILLSGMQQATSSISANLKGGASEDTPIRKREHHWRFRPDTEGEDHDNDSGVVMIIPEGEVGPVAPPDVMTSDLEAYIKGILKSREKDWDVMGARRVAELWNGSVADIPGHRLHRKSVRRMGSMAMSMSSDKAHNRGGGVLKKRTVSRDMSMREEDGEHIRGAIKEISGRAGQALKGGFGLVSRRGTAYETSDSETGGPGPSSLKSALLRSKRSTVPTVVEPDVEEVDEQLNRLSVAPSSSASHRHLDKVLNSNSVSSTRPSFLTATAGSLASKRPSIVTQLSANESDVWSRTSLAAVANASMPMGRSPTDDAHGNRSDEEQSLYQGSRSRTVSDRTIAWRDTEMFLRMHRTASDGADVVIEENGMEWAVTNPHGTGRRDSGLNGKQPAQLTRRHSFEPIDFYGDMRRVLPEHLQVDVEMCAVVLDLREKEKQLAQRVRDVKLLEESVFRAGSQLVHAVRSRRTEVDKLSSLAAQLRLEIEQDTMDGGDALTPGPSSSGLGASTADVGEKFHYYLSEETHRPELLDDLGRMREMWQGVKETIEERRKVVEDTEKRSWWRFGLL